MKKYAYKRAPVKQGQTRDVVFKNISSVEPMLVRIKRHRVNITGFVFIFLENEKISKHMHTAGK
jgi:hypothetical protein